MTASATLVEPAFLTHPDYHVTLGPEVADLLDLAGYPPDPEQAMLLDLIFAVDRYGSPVADEVVVICPRQNLKTGLFKMAALGKVFLLERPLFVWSAHEFSTTQEAFRDLQVLIESTPTLDRQVKHIHQASGSEAIELLGGQRIKFKARTKAGGRGLTGDDVLLDEGFALQPAHMGALQPTMAARPESQLLIGSSAGLADSEVLRGFRDRGRPGDKRLVYAEWCVRERCHSARCTHTPGEPGCVFDDLEQLRFSNPALGRRILVRKLESFRRSMPPAEFVREFGGQWDEPDADALAIPMRLWLDCEDADTVIGDVEAFAVATDPGREWSAIGAAGPSCECEPPMAPCEATATAVELVEHARDTGWVVPRCRELSARHGSPRFVVDGGGPAASLIPELERAGLRVLVARTQDVARSFGLFVDAVKGADGPALRHGPQQELTDAVRVAKTRPCGDGGTAFGRKASDSDITPIEAVSLAHWAAVTAPKVDILRSIW